jgi:hypothetical protein
MGWLEDFVTWLGANAYIPFGLSGDNYVPLYPQTTSFYEAIIYWAGAFIDVILSLGIVLPTILMLMFAVAVLTSIEKLDPQPLIEFFFLLWDTAITVTSLAIQAIDAVLPL